MRNLPSTLVAILLAWTSASAPALLAQEPARTGKGDEQAPSTTADAALDMTKAVVCRSIDGYEKYDPLPGASLTQDEKLLIYYRPLNYETVHEDEQYRVHLVQDGQLRRRGEKAVLRRKARILDYEPVGDQPPGMIYLKNSVPLKGLPPGDYEYDITLRDENNPGPPAVQSVKFTIVPPKSPKARSGKRPGRNRPAPGSATDPQATSRSGGSPDVRRVLHGPMSCAGGLAPGGRGCHLIAASRPLP